ncbi:hypothetical protein Pint_21023 [Pistacia integerrima]|uniref:Uncharacterized protein n=1 Tax=Pistacia integerrima TaxID=434235 RepID=A0ACC0X9U1_9ROSI|nr:hypothetical protein Pint_21023 [Pistacia integerrima]
MAGNVEFDDDDIEHGHNTNQIQTFATPKYHIVRASVDCGGQREEAISLYME